MPTTRFGLIRHAETQWNRERRIQGHSDSALTVSGKSEVQAWAHLLKTLAWDRILASDTGRALKTAEIINTQLNIQLTTDQRLREQNWGSWTAKTWDQVKAEASQMIGDYQKAGWDFCPPGGESRKDVLNRGCEALTAAAKRWPHATILVVTHEGIIRCLLYHFSGLQFLPAEPVLIKPRHLHWLTFSRDGLQAEEINALALAGRKSEKFGEVNSEKDTDDT